MHKKRTRTFLMIFITCFLISFMPADEPEDNPPFPLSTFLILHIHKENEEEVSYSLNDGKKINWEIVEDACRRMLSIDKEMHMELLVSDHVSFSELKHVLKRLQFFGWRNLRLNHIFKGHLETRIEVELELEVVE